MESLIAELREGITLNRWYSINEYHLNAYIRITKRYFNGIFYNTIEVANIKVDEEYQHKGYFSAFLNELENLANSFNRILYVESVINPILKKYLRKCKYKIDERETSCFYKC